MAIDTMKKGSIEMLTLFLLCEEDAYGYLLVQKIKERSKDFITVAFALTLRPGVITRVLGRITGPALIALIVLVVGLP